MNTDIVLVMSFTLYKIVSLGVGALFCFLGYRLFMAGIWGNAGNLDAKFKDAKLVLKSAAPGTFFAVLGAAIVVVSLIQGMNFYSAHGGDTLSTQGKPTLP